MALVKRDNKGNITEFSTGLSTVIRKGNGIIIKMEKGYSRLDMIDLSKDEYTEEEDDYESKRIITAMNKYIPYDNDPLKLTEDKGLFYLKVNKLLFVKLVNDMVADMEKYVHVYAQKFYDAVFDGKTNRKAITAPNPNDMMRTIAVNGISTIFKTILKKIVNNRAMKNLIDDFCEDYKRDREVDLQFASLIILVQDVVKLYRCTNEEYREVRKKAKALT